MSRIVGTTAGRPEANESVASDLNDIIPLRSNARRRPRRGRTTAFLALLAAVGALLVVAGGVWQVADPAPALDQPVERQAAVAPAALAIAEDRPIGPSSDALATAALPRAAPLPPTVPASSDVASPVATTPPAFVASRVLAAGAIADHLVRAEALLEAGDLTAARLFFERVAEAGDARGALGLARSHDPEELRRLPVYGHAGDASEAERWRETAKTMGGVEETAR